MKALLRRIAGATPPADLLASANDPTAGAVPQQQASAVNWAIRVKNLAVHYGNTPALQNVSLDIQQGCITAIIGPSGCGKTSFLLALNRLTDLIPACRVSGQVQLGPTDLYAAKKIPAALRREVGMIFQKPTPFPISIRRNIELPLREYGVTQKAALEETLQQVLRDTGLWDEVKDRLDKPALTLSGGQQQRLCIARALALQPSILLMDEPCSALDPLSSGTVEALIQSLGGRYTVVIVTHNLAQAKRISDYAGLFWATETAGELVEYGHGTQLFNSPCHELTAAYVAGVRG